MTFILGVTYCYLSELMPGYVFFRMLMYYHHNLILSLNFISYSFDYSRSYFDITNGDYNSND